jgi:predicted NAD/FAD-binding protein
MDAYESMMEEKFIPKCPQPETQHALKKSLIILRLITILRATLKGEDWTSQADDIIKKNQDNIKSWLVHHAATMAVGDCIEYLAARLQHNKIEKAEAVELIQYYGHLIKLREHGTLIRDENKGVE